MKWLKNSVFDDCVNEIPNCDDILEIKSKKCIKEKYKVISGISFYKYYSPKEHNIEAFFNDELYLSRAQDFNDPFDSYYGYDFSNSINTFGKNFSILNFLKAFLIK